MQDIAELHLKPETLARYDSSLGMQPMIASTACVSDGIEDGGIDGRLGVTCFAARRPYALRPMST